MAEKAASDPQPSVGRIVRYRSRSGLDMAAIITAVIPDTDEQAVHLEVFAPPGTGKDILDYEWGVAQGSQAGTWHWPERT